MANNDRYLYPKPLFMRETEFSTPFKADPRYPPPMFLSHLARYPPVVYDRSMYPPPPEVTQFVTTSSTNEGQPAAKTAVKSTAKSSEPFDTILTTVATDISTENRTASAQSTENVTAAASSTIKTKGSDLGAPAMRAIALPNDEEKTADPSVLESVKVSATSASLPGTASSKGDESADIRADRVPVPLSSFGVSGQDANYERKFPWLVQWLRTLDLEQYAKHFADNGFDNEEVVMAMETADIDEIGIRLAGHRKKLQMGIIRLNSVQAMSSTISLSSIQDGSPRAPQQDGVLAASASIGIRESLTTSQERGPKESGVAENVINVPEPEIESSTSPEVHVAKVDFDSSDEQPSQPISQEDVL